MPEMKNSNIEWIDEIPSDWDLIRLQFCLKEINVKNNPVQTTQVLSLMKDVGVLPYEEKGDIGNKSKDNVSEYHLAYPNTIVLNCMNILIGSVGISNYFGCVSPVYYVFKETDKCDLRFVNYIFNTREFQKELRKYAKGILEIRLRVSADDIFKQKIPLPAKNIQIRIANFLDQKCSEIDSLSADIQSQINVLEEYKKSVITEAVTKGLNPDVEMKDSGIEWIGMIPVHWDVKPLKYNFTITSGSTPNSTIQDFWDGDVLWITPADFKTDDYYTSGGRRNISKLGYQSCSTNIIPSNSIIFSKRAPIGSVVINSVPLCTNQGCLACIPNTKLNIKFYYFVMSIYDEIFNLFGNGTTFKEISATVFSNMHFAEPTLEEQQEIVDFLDKKCAEIDAIIASKKTQLETLAEYKKSLIYEYVTGKKEVPSNEF